MSPLLKYVMIADRRRAPNASGSLGLADGLVKLDHVQVSLGTINDFIFAALLIGYIEFINDLLAVILVFQLLYVDEVLGLLLFRSRSYIPGRIQA